ncbi:nuclear receptor coactivator 2 isoform X2 [Patella vulgata]|nr:nuclear receptor coactivator 2 isoform X2 [Patella vulgata]
MSAFSKPDKCAILQETVNTIQQISKEEIGSSEAVQQSQVSSSKPSILANDLLGPLLLEALDGFLFVVNSQGKVDFVSENVKDYLKYNQDDLVGKSIYNIIHVGDHAQFSNNLLPMSLGNNLRFSNENSVNNKAKNFNCRMLIKPPSDEDNDIELKSYVWQYESMQITAVLQPYLGEKFSESYGESENQTCLVCISRLLPLTEKANMMIGIEQFTTKQDLSGKILAYDSRSLANNHRIALEFVGQPIQEFCHANDIQQLNKHFQEVRKNGSNTSSVYRFKLLEGKYVFVQTKSKLFSNPISNEAEFVMSTHSIIRECDSEVELKGSASTSLMKSIIGPSGSSNRGNNMSSGLSSSLPMGVLGGQNNFMSPQSSSKMNISDTMSDFDFLNSNNWDSVFGSEGSSDLLNSLTNVSTSGSSPVTSNPWQGLPKMSPNSSILNTMPSPGGSNNGLGNKKPSALNFTQRNNSLSFDGQTSPGYPVSPGPRSSSFQVPSGRLPGYPGQRSPGSAGQMRAQYHMAGQQKKNPMMSPPATASSWGRSLSQDLQPVSSSVSSHSPHRPLEHSLSADLSPRYADKINFDTSNGGGAGRTGKLCQLLTQDTSFNKSSALYKQPKIARSESASSARSFMDRLDYSPFESISQSPQPGTGQSSPEKPQSTSNEDGESVNGKLRDEKKDNLILKKLLSQDDDGEGVPSIMDQEVTSSPQTSNKNDNEANIDLDRNEAEAKKPSNAILKQLLNDDSPDGGEATGEEEEVEETGDSKKVPSELLQKLLQEEENSMLTPGETTIREADSGSRSRHQSGHQDLQPSSSSQPNPSQQHPLMDESILRMFNSNNKKSATDANLMQNKTLDSLLNSLWERDSNTNTTREMEMRLRVQKKRKASASDVDSTDMSDTEPSQSRLSQKNALLAQLLSKKAAKENMVLSTQQTVKPTLVPQSRIPKNIIERLIQVKNENKDKEGNMPNPRDNPQTNPNIPFPGNTKPNQSYPPFSESSQDSFLNSNYESENSQLDAIQQLLNQSESMEVDNNGDTSDPLLQQILQQAADLEQDISFNSNSSNPQQQQQHQQQPSQQQPHTQQQQQQQQQHHQQPSNLPSYPSTNPHHQQQQTPPKQSQPPSTNSTDVPSTDDAALISQLEQLIGDSNNWSDIDILLSSASQNPPAYNSQDASDQMAINAIQRQLMGEDVNNTNFSQPMMSELLNRQMASQAQNRMNQSLGQQGMGGLPPGIDGQYNHQQVPNCSGLPPGYNPALQGVPVGQHGPRFSQPQGGIPGQPPTRHMFRGMNQSAMGAQVRQSILQQQKQKQFEKRQRLQAVERQRLLQQQHMRQFGPRFQASNSLDGNQPPFPENLNELMNTGHAPNVTLPVQRGQSLPSPLSPRYNTGNLQPLSPMLPPSTPPSQLSPHFNAPSQQQQWNMRPQQTGMTGQYNIQRHRSLSGGNIPNSGVAPPPSGFTLPDTQFTGNQSKMGLLPQSPQNQQLYARQMLQRQMSLPPGRGSPRTPHSPFGNSPDPMLMSPNSTSRPPPPPPPGPQQVSPPYSQGAMSSGGFNNSQPMSAPPSYSATPLSTSVSSNNTSQSFNDFDLSNFIDSPMSGLESKKSMDMVPNSTSQYVKQELRNICNARSEKQLQSQQLQLPHEAGLSYDTGGELPLDILETINDMAKEHGGGGLGDYDDMKNEDVLSQSRNEARKRYEQFRALSTPDQEDPAAKATSVFRNQLLTNQQLKQAVKQGGGKPEHITSVNVVQKEPRTPIDDIKPADQKNSLLQQLLSE